MFGLKTLRVGKTMNKHETKSIKKIIKELKITKAELVKTFGYTSSKYISNSERGLCWLPLGAISKIKKALECKK